MSFDRAGTGQPDRRNTGECSQLLGGLVLIGVGAVIAAGLP
jgi:hypothetical protein